MALLVPVLFPLNDRVGYWLSLVIPALAVAAVSVLIALPVIPIKKRRAALDAERGLFECAHREIGSALKQRWAIGHAKAEPGRILFQAKTRVTGRLVGSVEVYSQPRAMGEPAKAAWSVFPRGKVITLSTVKGSVELAATAASLDLLAERSLSQG